MGEPNKEGALLRSKAAVGRSGVTPRCSEGAVGRGLRPALKFAQQIGECICKGEDAEGGAETTPYLNRAFGSNRRRSRFPGANKIAPLRGGCFGGGLHETLVSVFHSHVEGKSG
jgi:hypothetical protein